MKQPVVTTWFPTSIYSCEELLTKNENEELYEYTLNLSQNIKRGGDVWQSKVYNTCETFDLRTDEKYNKILNLIETNVNYFSKVLGSDYNYKCNGSWFNVYKKNDYQERHIHADSIFSAIYYLKCKENSSPTIFYHPHDEMIPLKNLTLNELSFQTCNYSAIERTLIIFRSHVAHMVPQNVSDERVTLSFNFSS
jgi:uncharacterized protein (TIGR02466 family)